MSKYAFKGTHILLDAYNISMTRLSDYKGLEDALRASINIAKASLIEVCVNHFAPAGFSMIFVLRESHIAIHTYPEYNSAFADVFMCGNKNPTTIIDSLLMWWKPEKNVQTVWQRGKI